MRLETLARFPAQDLIMLLNKAKIAKKLSQAISYKWLTIGPNLIGYFRGAQLQCALISRLKP